MKPRLATDRERKDNMGIKVGKFIAGRNYRFIKDFTDDMRPIAPIEYHAGDIVTFDGPNMGRARF
ncbi:MAG: hypothetical protein U1D67_00535, partial [Dehalococcoidia bacterium]|nr:hypothetical protein [Dehalococcoidia bacterium]